MNIELSKCDNITIKNQGTDWENFEEDEHDLEECDIFHPTIENTFYNCSETHHAENISTDRKSVV